MKQGKRIRPIVPIEYRLLITPKLKERGKNAITLIALRTVIEFTNFRYDIIVEPKNTDRTLHFNIRGLRAPQVSLPGTGPAIFKSEYENLEGPYDLIISKHGKDEIKLKKSPQNKFIEIVTDENEW
jgi:hypothetical protein